MQDVRSKLAQEVAKDCKTVEDVQCTERPFSEDHPRGIRSRIG